VAASPGVDDPSGLRHHLLDGPHPVLGQLPLLCGQPGGQDLRGPAGVLDTGRRRRDGRQICVGGCLGQPPLRVDHPLTGGRRARG
jgi:hypothetical protein